VFVVLLAASGAFAAVAAPAFLELLPRDDALVASLRAAIQAPETLPPPSEPGAWLSGIIPSNIIAAAAASAMLPLVVFSMFFGFALTRLEPERRARMLELVRAVGDTMIIIVHWVLWAAPLGVFALVLAVCAKVGLGMIGALGYYILTQCTLYIAVTLMLYFVAMLAAGERLKRFATALIPVQVIAGSTQSSLASLPVMIDSARTRLGYPLEVTSLVLPMAVSLFRIASPVQYLVVATFIAWMYGVDLTASQLATAIALSIAISMGSVGLPGQVSCMTTNVPVTQAMGLPVEPLGILLAVDTIPDVFATIANTSADVTATGIVAKRTAAAGASLKES
jgi:proton glutamate symport protein